MINSIKVNNLRNGEFAQFVADVLAVVNQNNPAQLNVQEQYDSLLALSNSIESIFKTPTGNIISTELEELDLRRDNALYGINGIITANSYNTNAAIKNSAAMLASHLSIFGTNIAQDSYQGETAKLRNIINDWETKPNLAAALTDLGLKAWSVELANANNSFSQKYLARASEMGSSSTETMKTLRLQANDAYYLLRDHLNAYYTINKGADPFGKTVSFINGLLDNYNSLLSRRTGTADTPVSTVTQAQVA